MKDALRSLRHRDYGLFFWGQLISMVGTWAQQTAQSWLVYRLTGSGTLLGITAAAGHAPSLLLGLYAGAAADRWDRRRLLLWVRWLALAQSAALAVLTALDLVQVWHVVALSVALGVINVFDMPARQAFVPELVPREDMGNAIALNSIIVNVSRLAGPALAGLLIARAGEAACFGLNAASYLAAIGALLAIPARGRPARAEAGGELARIRAGLRYAFADPERRGALMLLTVISVTAVPAVMMLPIYSEGVLRSGPEGLGALSTVFGLGALGSSYFFARGARPGPGAAGWSAAVFGLSTASLAVLPWFAAGCAALFVAGWSMMSCFTGSNIRLQDRSSDEMRGRVMGLYSMTFMAATPFGSLALGWASDRFGAPAALAACGLACAAGAALYLGPDGYNRLRADSR